MSEDKSMSEAKDEMTAQPCSSGLGQQDEDGEDFSYSSSDWVPSDEETESCDSDAETKAKKKHLEHCKRQYPRPGISPSNIDVTESRNDLNINPEIVKRTQAVVDKIKQTLEMLAALKEDRGFRTISLQSAENGDSPPIAPNLTAYTADNELQGSSSQPNGSLDESKRKKRDNLVLKEPYNKKGFIIKKNTVGGENVKEEWVPIGSGMTLIPREKYKRINWKSYTIATRSLLVAVFPRRVLATHSLTGKPSPAFQDKPAKMTLDQRKTSDVIAEVVDRFKVRENLVRVLATHSLTGKPSPAFQDKLAKMSLYQRKTSDVIAEVVDRFKVRENLVRSVIATKCADECKMWQTRCKKIATKIKEATDTVPRLYLFSVSIECLHKS